jgi:hypothetical protein
MRNEFLVPLLGLGDEQSPPVTVTWKEGTVIYRGILGGYEPAREPHPPANVVSLDEWRNKNESLRQRPI